ncbi:membrane protein of unknown function (plasmid) [Caballeronia sp. S22]
MHLLGLEGMPRRVWTYPHGLGWDGMNLTGTIGAYVIAVSVLLFIINVVRSLRSDERASADPWGAGTLEWSVPSPPPPHNFDAVPVVHGRDPLWEPFAQPAFVASLAADAREVLVTTVLDAQPDHRPMLPTPSIWPFASAVATTILFIGSIYTPWAIVWASPPVVVAMIGWFWPNRGENRVAVARKPAMNAGTRMAAPRPDDRDTSKLVLDVRALPTFAFSHRSLMWWSTMGLMLIEGTVFAIAVMMYFYLRTRAPSWPMAADAPRLLWGTLNMGVLLASLWPNQLAKNAAERGDRAKAALWLAICLAASLAFLAIRGFEFAALNVSWYTNAYGSAVWLLLGLHTTHLITDTVDTAVLAVLLFTGPVEGKRLVDVTENALYWYFVALSWLPIYLVIYGASRI